MFDSFIRKLINRAARVVSDIDWLAPDPLSPWRDGSEWLLPRPPAEVNEQG